MALTPFPEAFPSEAAATLYNMLSKAVPFDRYEAELASWNLLGFGLKQLTAQGRPLARGQMEDPAQHVIECLDPKRKSIPIPWNTLIPAILQLLVNAFFPGA